MKNKLLILVILIELFMMISWESYSQNNKVIEKIVVKTSLQCDMCKDRIINNLSFEKGIKDIEVNVEEKTVTVQYNSEKTTPDQIRKAISKIGYDADNVPADPAAYAKLPKCCQKGGHGGK
ncbi:MAG: heavy metal-associated domain-containing protein [Bacteroidales bacterium]|nr:heavy-metal-associated domain-containing protein [Lentimicrobiaceae bacterium]MDD5694017.1 heavy metal-associated domain-containing protein [Bacteroidales bacterium]